MRDDEGVYLGAECRKYGHVSEPAVVELLVCRDAMSLVLQKSWQFIEIEIDCQVVVNAWNNKEVDRSVCGQIVREMKSWVSSFQGFNLCFARRTANKMAHACARAAVFFYHESDLLSSMKK